MTAEIELLTIRVARLERGNRFFKLAAAGAALGDIETETVWDVKAPAIAGRGFVLLREITEVGVNPSAETICN